MIYRVHYHKKFWLTDITACGRDVYGPDYVAHSPDAEHVTCKSCKATAEYKVDTVEAEPQAQHRAG